MALSNYTELLASSASWLNRVDLGAQLPDFVVIAESAIASDVRLREQLTVTTLSTVANQEFVALPADFLEFKYIKAEGKPLEYLPPDKIRRGNDTPGFHLSSELRSYSIEGERLILSPISPVVATLDVCYYAKLSPLATTPTNFLLVKHPMIYLYKVLSSANKYLMDEARAMYWDAKYSEEVQKLHDANARAVVSGSPLRIRTR